MKEKFVPIIFSSLLIILLVTLPPASLSGSYGIGDNSSWTRSNPNSYMNNINYQYNGYFDKPNILGSGRSDRDHILGAITYTLSIVDYYNIIDKLSYTTIEDIINQLHQTNISSTSAYMNISYMSLMDDILSIKESNSTRTTIKLKWGLDDPSYWIERLKTPLWENGTKIYVFGNGDIIISGRVYKRGKESSNRTVISKINSNGLVEWYKYLEFPGKIITDSLYVDNNGYIYIAGAFEDPSTSEPKGFLVKIDSNGRVSWSKIYRQGIGFFDIFVDDYIYVAGTIGTSPININGLLAKLDKETCKPIWSIKIDAGNITSIIDIEVVDNHIYSLLFTLNLLDFRTDMLVIDIDSSGKILWANKIHTPGFELASRLIVVNGRVITANSYLENIYSGSIALTIVTFSSDGELIGNKKFYIEGSRVLDVNGIAYNNDTLYIAGILKKENKYYSYLFEAGIDDPILTVFNNVLINRIHDIYILNNTLYFVGTNRFGSNRDIIVARLNKESLSDISKKYTIKSTNFTDFNVKAFDPLVEHVDIIVEDINLTVIKQQVTIIRLYPETETITSTPTTPPNPTTRSTSTSELKTKTNISIISITATKKPVDVFVYIILMIPVAIVIVVIAILIVILKK
ncbi:MAG: hypothetical protein B6U89_03975 [Desulfurococcales archaeon ex4484_58]|nr:MAG: hypothetical protein B6U89_03975 [Desulfurococcales archaeon ex4484_58]